MLGTALQQSIQRFRHSVSEGQRKQFEGCSLQVLQDEILYIQRQLDATKQLRDFNRLKNFLKAMTQIQTLAQEFLDVSEEMGYILGPIQFALMEASSAASERIDILEGLLDTYVEVGKVVPSLRQYYFLFESSETALGVLEDYFCDILEFQRLIMDVFARPGWRNVGHPFKARERKELYEKPKTAVARQLICRTSYQTGSSA
ncbi:hypothetical protein NUW58_g2794 [Xylaria curta]|uniref:Uncharacterized protein n=1 Tax=Xylaria curta TaxID=42375 RepID=A0ACC1PFM4_9PEZI|nr:hypothetical protein NUW58_g2794 [Xylaria curta]